MQSHLPTFMTEPEYQKIKSEYLNKYREEFTTLLAKMVTEKLADMGNNVDENIMLEHMNQFRERFRTNFEAENNPTYIAKTKDIINASRY